MRIVKLFAQALRSSAVLAAVLLAGYLAQSFAVTVHVTHHSTEKIFSATDHGATVSDRDCSICDSAQLTPQTPSVVVDLGVAPLVRIAPQLPPIFWSDNAILLPFGARAPPSLLT